MCVGLAAERMNTVVAAQAASALLRETFMKSSTSRILALRAMGEAKPCDFAEWALTELQHRGDLPSLCIVAGFQESANPSEVDDYFCRALREGGIAVPDAEEALWLYAYELAVRLLDDSIDVDDALCEYTRLYHAFPPLPELQTFFLIHHEMADQRAGAEYHEYIDVTESTYRAAAKEAAKMLSPVLKQRGYDRRLQLESRSAQG